MSEPKTLEDAIATVCIDKAQAVALERLGFVIVPKEATKEMLRDADKAIDENIDATADSFQSYEVYDRMVIAAEAWKAMLAARPKLGNEG